MVENLINENLQLNSSNLMLKSRVKTSNRISYEAQVEVIKRQIGDLESIRLKLNLSQRKIAQLLMVDPSAWSRWTTKGEAAPPHIYRALHWYMTLQEQIPGLNAAYFLQKDTLSIKKEIQNFTNEQMKSFERNIVSLNERANEIVQNSSKDILKLEDEIVGLKSDISQARSELLKSKNQHLKFKKLAIGFSVVVVIFTVLLVYIIKLNSHL